MIINELVSKFSFSVGNSFKVMNKRFAGTVKTIGKGTNSIVQKFKDADRSISRSWQDMLRRMTGRYRDEMGRLRDSQHRFVKDWKLTHKSMGKGFSLGPMGNTLAGIGAGVSASAAIKSIYETGTSRESMLVGLKNLPNMNELKARMKFKELEQFNLETPYTLAEIVKAYTRLENIGLDSSKRAMQAYGGIAASVPGKKINDFVEAVADGVMGEAERLKEFSIGMKKDGDEVTLSFRNQKYKIKNDAKEIERTLQKIAFDNFGKAMAEMAKTTEGKMSNLSDAFDNLKWQVWEGGMKQAARAFIEGASKMLESWTPLVKQFVITTRLRMPDLINKLTFAVGILSSAVAVLAARWVGIKYLAIADWAGKTAIAIRTLGLAQWFLNGAVMFLPTLIGGVVIALAALIGDFVYWFNTGDSLLLKFTERWPVLHDWIKNAYEMNKIFWTAVGMGIEKIGIKFNDFFGKLKVWFEWLKDEFGIMLENLGFLADGYKRALDSVTGVDSNRSFTTDQNGVAITTADGRTVYKNQRLAQDFIRVGKDIYSGAKMCLRGVWLTEQAVMKGTSPIKAQKAYQAADQIAQDKRFLEVKFTPEMYKRMMAGDKALQNMMYGATVIYNRQSGFSPTAGHAEKWDTINKKAHYGLGPKSMVRSDQMLTNARYFIPVTSTGAGANVNITNNFNAPVKPQQVKRETKAGVKEASRNLATNQPIRSAPGSAGSVMGF